MNESRVLHLLDAEADADPLLRVALAASPGADVLARRLSDPVLRWRAARELRRRRAGGADVTVAWGEAAAEVARRTPALTRAIYRPGDAPRRLALPWAGTTAVADSAAQARRLQRVGWAQSNVVVIPPPVLFDTALTRRDIGASADDFLWLAAAEGNAASGLRAAVWAATIAHVVERPPLGRRHHRLLVVGDGPAHRLAKRFADQLGLPGLCVGVARYEYADVARLADAAVLLPDGPTGARSAAVVAALGLPAVVNGRAEVREFLEGRANVRVVSDPKPRVIAREMLWLAESGALVRRPHPASEEPARSWNQVLEGTPPGPTR